MNPNENHPDYEIKLPKVRNIQSTFVPESYPKSAISWMIEFNATRKPNKK